MKKGGRSRFDKVARATIGALTPGALAKKISRASDAWAEGDFGNVTTEIPAIVKRHYGIEGETDAERAARLKKEKEAQEQEKPVDDIHSQLYANVGFVILVDAQTIKQIHEYGVRKTAEIAEAAIPETDAPNTAPTDDGIDKHTEEAIRQNSHVDQAQQQALLAAAAQEDTEHGLAPFKVSTMRKWGTRTVLVCDVHDREYFKMRDIVSFTLVMPGIKDYHYAPAKLYARSSNGAQIQKISDLSMPFIIKHGVVLIGRDTLADVGSKIVEREIKMPEVEVNKDEGDEILHIKYVKNLVHGRVFKPFEKKQQFYSVIGYLKNASEKVVVRPYNGNAIPGMRIDIQATSILFKVFESPVLTERYNNIIRKYMRLDEAKPSKGPSKQPFVNVLANLIAQLAADDGKTITLDATLEEHVEGLTDKGIFGVKLVSTDGKCTITLVTHEGAPVGETMSGLNAKFSIDASQIEESSVLVTDATTQDEDGNNVLKSVQYVDGLGLSKVNSRDIVDVRNGKHIYSGKIVHVLTTAGTTELMEVVGKDEESGLIIVRRRPDAYKVVHDDILDAVKRRTSRHYRK